MAALSAITDNNTDRLARASELHPAASRYTSLEQMLEKENLGAVLVSLPTPYLADAARQVLSRGLPLYLEKPISGTLTEAEKIKQTWTLHRPTVMVGFNFRRAPVFQEARRVLENDRLGPVHHLHSVNSRHAMEIPPWKKLRETGGGVLLDLASHHLDLWEHLLDDRVVDISVQTRSLRSSDDTATIQAITASGISCTGFFAFDSVEEDRLTVYGRDGRMSVERMSDLRVSLKRPSSRFVRVRNLLEHTRSFLALPRLIERYRSPWSCSSYERSLEVFLKAVLEGKSVKPDLDDGIRVLELIEAAEADH